MADLRKAARGRECQVRIPGVCNGNPETSVLAHIRLAGLCGTGIKPPDLIATIACSACHDEIDRRTHFVDAAYAKECALEGMASITLPWPPSNNRYYRHNRGRTHVSAEGAGIPR